MTTSPLLTEGSRFIDAETDAVLITFDSNLEETYSRGAQVSTFPRERRLPGHESHQGQQREIQLTAIVSNTPLVLEQSVSNRAQLYFPVVDDLVESGRVVHVVTGLGIFRDVMVQDYSIKRDFQTGQSLQVNFKLVQIDYVSLQTIDVPDDVIKALARASVKKTPSEDVAPVPENEAEKKTRKSFLLRGKNFFDKVFED